MSSDRSAYIIGITGGIATGKSTAASILVPALNAGGARAFLVDCDKLGHGAYAPGTPGFDQVKAAFGDDVVQIDASTGVASINRAVLGQKVFGNATEMKRLTDIVWPIIIAAALEQIEKESIALSSSTTTSAEEAKTVGPIIAVMEAAVLLEAGWDTSVNEVWVTLVDEKTACARLMARNNLTEEAAMKRIKSQMTNTERQARATVTIANEGSPEDLAEAVQKEAEKLVQRRCNNNTATTEKEGET